jgi:hypothetical protein
MRSSGVSRESAGSHRCLWAKHSSAPPEIKLCLGVRNVAKAIVTRTAPSRAKQSSVASMPGDECCQAIAVMMGSLSHGPTGYASIGFARVLTTAEDSRRAAAGFTKAETGGASDVFVRLLMVQ